MCSSVTVKALQGGWDVFIHTDGFFSAAADVCPVTGTELVCRALAMADSRAASLESGPTPTEVRGQGRGLRLSFPMTSQWTLTLQTPGELHGAQDVLRGVG